MDQVSSGRLPDFVVIGAVKAATSWLRKQLQVNPAIFMPSGEPHYFTSEYDRGEDHYRSLFANAHEGATRFGEKSADYLAHPRAAQRLAGLLPDARLIVQLRNPIERAYSDYKMLYRRGTVTGMPEEYLTSLDNPQPRFLQDGLYAGHIARWMDLFPAENIHVFLYDDVKQDPRGTIERVSAHIGVDPVFDPELAGRRQNDSTRSFLPLPVRKALAPFKQSVAPLRGKPWFEAARALLAKPITYPALSPELRKRLEGFYAEDISRLERMLNRDLSHWLGQSRLDSAA